MNEPSKLSAYPYVPSTVSPEAQSYLREATPVGGPFKSKEEFVFIRKSFSDLSKADNDKGMKYHVTRIEKIKIDGVDVLRVTSKNPKEDGILIYIHGGAHTFGSADHLSQVFAEVADIAGLETYAINYRLAPEHPFPAGLEDCLKVYKTLLKSHDQAKVFLLGDSSGGH
jgi:acetyl esterase/lipase